MYWMSGRPAGMTVTSCLIMCFVSTVLEKENTVRLSEQEQEVEIILKKLLDA